MNRKMLYLSVLMIFVFLFSVCAQPNTKNNLGTNNDDNENFLTGGYTRMIKLIIGNTTLTATLVDNSSARALEDLLSKGDITLDMQDYGNFEKVAELGTTLPTNDEDFTTEAGDLILYLGRRFVIYYDTNTWDFTRLGKIDNITQSELKRILGTGNIKVTLSK